MKLLALCLLINVVYAGETPSLDDATAETLAEPTPLARTLTVIFTDAPFSSFYELDERQTRKRAKLKRKIKALKMKLKRERERERERE
jgi:hypothetical protein